MTALSNSIILSFPSSLQVISILPSKAYVYEAEGWVYFPRASLFFKKKKKKREKVLSDIIHILCSGERKGGGGGKIPRSLSLPRLYRKKVIFFLGIQSLLRHHNPLVS